MICCGTVSIDFNYGREYFHCVQKLFALLGCRHDLPWRERCAAVVSAVRLFHKPTNLTSLCVSQRAKTGGRLATIVVRACCPRMVCMQTGSSAGAGPERCVSKSPSHAVTRTYTF